MRIEVTEEGDRYSLDLTAEVFAERFQLSALAAKIDHVTGLNLALSKNDNGQFSLTVPIWPTEDTA